MTEIEKQQFINKQERYKQQILDLRNQLTEIQNQLDKTEIQRDGLLKENQQLNNWIKCLLTYSDLPKSEIKQYCETHNSIIRQIYKRFKNLF